MMLQIYINAKQPACQVVFSVKNENFLPILCKMVYIGCFGKYDTIC